MKSLINRFLTKYNINLEGKKVIVGVSTGVDSMVLLTILKEMKIDVVVCHVNHKKREASNKEEEYIIDYCKKNNIKIYVKSLEDYNLLNGNFQEEARMIRLDFFKDVCSKEDARYIFLGHHLNDDIETFFMKLFRGSSFEAISGIKDIYEDNGITIVRPFLKVSKEEIIHYANLNNVVYFEDESNISDDYSRNRIRHHIIPEIYLEEPTFNKKFLEFKEMLQYSSLVISNLVLDTINNLISSNSDSFSFSKEEFLKLDYFIQKEVLFKLLLEYKFSKKNVEELIKYINSTRSNLLINYKDIQFIKEYDKITIVLSSYTENNNTIVIDEIKDYEIDDTYIISVSKKNNVFLANNSKIWYNSKDLPVEVRRVKTGDSISLGFGTKKVARILIDKKIPITQRKNTFVLVKDNIVLGVFNHARSINLAPKEECDIVITLKENENDY